jgi:hypothetical protein
MLRKTYILVLTLFAGLYATTSSAQIFDIQVTDYGSIPAGALRTFVDQQIQTAENSINKDFPSGAPDRLMEGMANSSVMAGKGIGTDYASNMSVFLIGAGVGVGADLAKPAGTDSPISGVGVAPGVIVGFNLGFLDTKSILGMDTDRLNLYFNFMSYDMSKKMGDPGKESEIDLSTLAYGTHVRYDWIKGSGNKLLGWGGVKLNFGFEYNKTTFGFKSKINESIDQTATTNERIKGTISGSPEASILANTTSIPLALSTDIQLLYFVSIYTGAGVDYNMGQAKGKGELNGNNSTLTCTGGTLCSTPTSITVKPAANLNTTAKVEPFLYRAFAGVQFNLPWTRIFVQVDKSLSNDLIGATTGLRFAF